MRKLLIYKDRIFVVDEGAYEPENYSAFLEENIILMDGEVALDVVAGIGFHAILMADRAAQVVAVDINPTSVECAKMNILVNRVDDIVEIRLGDLFGAVSPEERFDLIVAWPPQMPTPADKERSDWFGIANLGGRDGRRIIDRIIENSGAFLRKDGRLQLLHAWYSNIPKSMELLRSNGFAEVKITAEEHFPVGRLSFERSAYLEEIGFPFHEKDGQLVQCFAVVTAWWR